ncbi:MAG: 4-vinyl reductase [Anaerolineae bacterium]|nr:4-vinyl reductase [Anaerolineae bacterium]
MIEQCVPNRFGRFLLLALERTLGVSGLQGVLGRANLRHLADIPPDNLDREFPVGCISRLMSALEETYGIGKGRELAFQAGRYCFHLGLASFGFLADVANLMLPFFPARMRARIGLETLAEILNRFADGAVRVETGDGYLFWRVGQCGVCQGRTSSAPCCHLLAGLLQETVHWATRQHSSTVTEVTCTAAGGPCCLMEIHLR